MAVWKLLRRSLAAKFILGLAAATAILSFAGGYLNLVLERRHSERLIHASADRITDIIARSANYSMLRNDREALLHLINDIGGEPGVRRVRIYNEDGWIRYSTDAAEIDHSVDKRAEACFACHVQEEPLSKLPRDDRVRVFRLDSGERVLGLIRPVENKPECWNAACHAHDPSRRVLGVIDAHLSLANVDQELAIHQRNLFGATAGLTVLVSLFAAIFFYRDVQRPVRAIMHGTERVAGGDLSSRIQLAGEDELGRLATSFDEMTAALESAQAELRENASELERRVQAKTAELEQTFSTLVHSEKLASLGRLAAVVAHEVNNPLFGMLTYARLSLKKLSNGEPRPEELDEIRENLKIIANESKRCGEIMRNLLQFARQGSGNGGAQLNIEPVEPAAVLRRALKLIQHQLDLQRVEVAFPPASASEALACDPGQIQQALLVFLVNAAEVMPDGGRLTLSAETDPAAQQCVFRIRDTGPGIPPDALAKIFEPFFTTKEDRHRTGLGLAIAKGIVERHGGRIDVDTAPGRGTEFAVRLPLAPRPVMQGGEL
jgi:two-component system, NtrC family, sensor kinase